MKLVMSRGEGICPTQWYGKTATGLFVYGRYRHGCLTLSTGHTSDKAVLGDLILECEFEDEFDGYMEDDVFKDLLKKNNIYVVFDKDYNSEWFG